MMAADVSTLVRIMNGSDMNESGKSTALITRDLLGGGGGGGGSLILDSNNKELDLDMQVPSGWEKRLDLKSGKVYIQKCDSSNSSSSTSEHKKRNNNDAVSKLQDLNFPPSLKQPLSLFDESSLDLKLVPSSSASSSATSPSCYQSVCTLDKVKVALERAEKETIRKRSMISMSKSSSSSLSPRSNSSSSIKDGELDDQDEKSSATFAAGCPGCLLYVLISKNNPKCPRCCTIVPLPVMSKKPRIDLNISM